MAFPLVVEAYSDLAFFVLRLTIGIVFIHHAIGKLRDPQGMAKAMGEGRTAFFPTALGAFELICGISMISGFLVQYSALLLSGVMTGALYFKIISWKVSFTSLEKTGWEFDLTLLAANIIIFINGGGAIALG